MEFELEMQPNNSGWLLIWKTLKGATPALAIRLRICWACWAGRQLHATIRPTQRSTHNDNWRI